MSCEDSPLLKWRARMLKKARIELEAHWKGILEDFVGSNYGVGLLTPKPRNFRNSIK